VERIRQRESELIRFCKSPDFNAGKLEQILGETTPWSQTLEVR
jgi:hypothetical protein